MFGKECVSVLVRTRDIELYFRELLKRLSHQTLFPSELVIVDNYSSEESLRVMTGLLAKIKESFFSGKITIKLVPISNQEFTHSYSTNAGVLAAENDIICITNGHSLPSSNEWLEAGMAHFNDSKVAGVGGYTVSHTDGTMWEKMGYDLLWKKRIEVSKTYARDDSFSTVNCLIRKSLWKQYPFDEKLLNLISGALEFGGEDYDWAVEMKARGYKIVVEPKLVMFHSHGESLSSLFPKYLAWRQIRRKIRELKRPRTSYTRLNGKKPSFCVI